jgi:glycosyltransferase involved in cell wall biosynthesis
MIPAASAPGLSVVVPTHNRRADLERCLNALEVQTFTDFEVVVAVDGSTDGTVALLTSVQKRFPHRIEVLVLKHGGRSAARNAAMRAARGSVVVFCDDDVTLPPECLARHAAFHGVFPNAVAIGAVRYTDGTLEFPVRPSWVNLTGMNSSVPRAAALEAGGFDETLKGWGGEDLEFGIRLQKAGLAFKRLEGEPATHHAPRVRDATKAHSAGYQAVMIAKKHGGNVALQLGVHPSVLGVKGLYLNRVGDLLLRGASDYQFERAYLDGARAAWKELGEG